MRISLTQEPKLLLKGARNQLDGLLSQKVQELRSGLINASSFVELGLDFAEEDIEFIDNSELLNRIEKISNEINNLLDTYSFGRVIRDGVNVALVGQPNVGKSSILNYILKESRSIVSKLPGTTRDIIREEVSIDGILFKLFDTAGIRSSEDEIEKEGIYRSREAIKNADIVLLIHDVEQQLDDKILTEVYSLTTKEKVLIVFNKIDLIKTEQALEKICVSALTGKGMENLLTKLKSLALGNSVYSEKSEVISSLRHYHCLSKANEYLDLAKKSILNKLSSEFISVDLRNAENSLGEIIGLVTTDDILNNIFMSFCIGK